MSANKDSESFEEQIAAIYECQLCSPELRMYGVDKLIALYREHNQIGLPEYSFLENANRAFDLFEELMDAAEQAYHWRMTRE